MQQSPSPFNVAYQAGTNFAKSFKDVREESALDNILNQAMSTNDPDVLQNTIAQIISKVSPEKQAAAVGLVKDKLISIKEKELQAKQSQAAKEGGYNPYAPAGVQTQQVKDKNKSERLKNFYGNNQSNESNLQQNIPVAQMSNREQLINLSGHPDREVSEPAKARLKELQKAETENRADLRETRKEVAPLKKEIINRADLSRESIRNKSNLLDLIDKGNLDDPTFAVFASSLPFNLGKRLLSEDTVTYKGGLVDEFADLKNIFKGATRVKEVEIYEDKLADIYLTNEQKKAILKSRINTAKIDLIREDAATEVELKYPNISALQFNKKVDEIAKPQVNALFNSIWNEQKAILDQAENMKKLTLDENDPQDLQIIDSILEEANGNYKKAEEIAKKKGYKFK